MHKQLLISHFRNQRMLFLHHLHRTLNEDNFEDLHQLRVTIKKLRALWSLVEVISKGAYSKKPHQQLTARLFNQGGKVREAQVNIAVINSLHENYLASSTEYLQKTEKKANVHFTASVLLFDLKKMDKMDRQLEAVIKGISNKVLLKESIAYVRRKIRKVHDLMKQLPDHHKLHRIRIRLKSVNAIQSIIHEITDESKIEKLRNNITSINDLIGLWHDYDELLLAFDEYLSTKQKKKEKQKIKALVKKIEAKQKAREKEIRQKLHKYLSKASLRPLKKMQKLLKD